MLNCPETEPIVFEENQVKSGDASITFAALSKAAWINQISLSSTGYYATPGIEYDPSIGRGRPFFYYAFGGAVSEVEVMV